MSIELYIPINKNQLSTASMNNMDRSIDFTSHCSGISLSLQSASRVLFDSHYSVDLVALKSTFAYHTILSNRIGLNTCFIHSFAAHSRISAMYRVKNIRNKVLALSK